MSTTNIFMTKAALFFVIIPLVSVSILLVSPFIGMETISPFEVFANKHDEANFNIFWKIRVPRVILAFLAGGALSIGGMVFQAMFRNVLATPFTLGVSSGAAFGASLYIKLGLSLSIFGIPGSSIFALIGALVTVSFLSFWSWVKQGASPVTMLLSGVMINFFFSSLIIFMQFLSDFTETFRITRWLMGGFEVIGYSALSGLLPFVALGLLVVLLSLRELNLLTLGEELAKTRGLNVFKTQNLLLFGTSLMVGGVVALSGPIGFVGIIVPYVCRLLVGFDHAYLTPATFFLGGAFLLVCDTVARTIIAPFEIPVGVITALIGGPFFLWVLLSKKEGFSES